MWNSILIEISTEQVKRDGFRCIEMEWKWKFISNNGFIQLNGNKTWKTTCHYWVASFVREKNVLISSSFRCLFFTLPYFYFTSFHLVCYLFFYILILCVSVWVCVYFNKIAYESLMSCLPLKPLWCIQWKITFYACHFW